MIYIIYTLIILFLLYLDRQLPVLNKTIRFLIPCVYILLIGLRGNHVGVDTPTYYQHYYMYGRFGCHYIEQGFDWVNRFCFAQKWLHYTFFTFCAAMAILPTAIAAEKRLGKNAYSIFILLLCSTTFVMLCNGMRQGIACGLFFYLIMLYEDENIGTYKKFPLFVIGILFASLFHASIFMVCPLFLLKYVHLSNKTYKLLYILSFVFVFINISSLIPHMEIGTRSYDYTGKMMNSEASLLGFSANTIKNISLLILLLRARLFEKYRLIANMTYFSMIINNMGYHIPLMSRISMYFTFINIMMMAIVLANKDIRNNAQTRTCVWVMFSLVVVLNVYGIISPTNRVLPYKFWWECSGFPTHIL